MPLRCAAHARFHLVEVKARLWSGRRPIADARLQAFVRPSAAVIEPARVRAALRNVPRTTGRTAVVIGASRGLGAATALAPAQQGYEVVGCYQVSKTRAAELTRGGPSTDGSIRMVRGDAADPAFCADLARQVTQRHGSVDVLVCSAGPVLRPMRLSTHSVLDLADYVAASIRLAAAPMGAFLAHLEQARGHALLISSQALSSPPADWPHYVAAKGALEHLVAALAPAHPKVRFLLARPPRMDTGYITQLIAGEPIASPITVAAQLVRELSQAGWHGHRVVEVSGLAD